MIARIRAIALLLSVLLFCNLAWAGSYLNRVTLLVGQGQKEAAYLRPRAGDRELARVVHELAAARLKAASEMLVPKEVALAHPHVLLVLENDERAAAAAAAGHPEKFQVYALRADEEETVLRRVLGQLGWPLPKWRG